MRGFGPVIDGRNRSEILSDLLARTVAYVPEWSATTGSPAHAFLSILARDVEIQTESLNGMPDRARLGFLSALGNSLLPAQSARTPLVFELMANAPLDVTLDANSQVAAKLPPPPPSLLGGKQETPTAPIFSTEDTVTLTRAKMVAVYSVDPDADTYADHTQSLGTGFTLFGDMKPIPHQIYIGHGSLLAVSANAAIELAFELAPTHASAPPRPLLIDWEYLSADGWLPLRIDTDQTDRLTHDGRITLRLDCGPDAKKDKVYGIESYWVRGTVSARTPSGTIGPLPAGYYVAWKESPSIVHTTVTITGTPPTNNATITKFLRSTITLDRPLIGAIPGAIVKEAGTGNFVGVVAGHVGAATLILNGLDVGRTVTIDGTTTATVVAELDGAAILDKPLSGLGNGAPLIDVADNRPVGEVTAFETDYFIPLDTAADFLKGDVVTVDATMRAYLTKVGKTWVTLDQPITNALQANALILADALPVLRPYGADTSGVLPSIDTIRVRVGFTKTNLKPDLAAVDAAPLDVGNAFHPFGKQPQKFTTFYLASKEVFQRKGAQVEILFTLAQAGKAYDDADAAGPNAVIWAVEYFNGDMWMGMGSAQKLMDGTVTMTAPDTSKITFSCPQDWAESKVNGKSNYWLRIRIDSGNYGHPLRLDVDASATPPTVKSDPATLQPPVIAQLRLQYTYMTNSNLVEHCVTYNDFAYADHSETARWPRSAFEPFSPVGDSQPAVHFGFSDKLPAGLVSLYFAAQRTDDTTGNGGSTASPYVWEYYSSRGWLELSVLDETSGFRNSGVIQFVGPPDAEACPGLGGEPFWLRAKLKPDVRVSEMTSAGLWLNTVWAHQGENVQEDTLGFSNGNPGQSFAFAPQRVPVLPGEVIEVMEWEGRGDAWQTAVTGVLPDDLRFVFDPTDGKTITQVWVRWHGQPHFYRSGPDDRHYVIERALGTVQFPTQPYGLIPPGGARINASYATGGGLDGNVPAGVINELHTSASYVQRVSNPFPATGGSATEVTPRARDRATQRMRHRDRAVAPADFEWIAREASPEVARARCLPITGPDGKGARGWVSLVVIPNSVEAAPVPTPGLLDLVSAALAARVPASIVGQIALVAPTYTSISVRADIAPDRAQDAALVEARVRERLATFLHPLVGGPAGDGWDFGASLYLSQVAAIVGGTEGVDCVPLLQLIVNDGVAGDVVRIDPDSLVTEGDHQLKLLAQVD